VQTGALTVTDAHAVTTRHSADLIVGGDGAGSLVRRSMAQTLPGFSVTTSQSSNHCTMIELDRVDGRLDSEYLHILAAHPMCVAGAINGEGGPADPRWFCMVGFDHKRVFADTAEARALLSRAPRLAALVSDASIQASAWRECQHIGRKLVCSTFAGGAAVLLGDAAAPFPPIGQGVNAAMESAVLLASCVAEAQSTPEGLRAAAARYSTQWKPEADAVSWIGEKFVFDSPLHTLRNALTTQFGFSVFKNSKRADISYAQAKQAAERLGLVWR
jgi:kynurenine 3-monooxygenase